MREIKFRGKPAAKAPRKNSWYFGSLIAPTFEGGATIIYTRRYGNIGVRADTVGQFTGLRDSNGVEVYEGDVLCSSDGKRDYFFCVFFDDCEMAWKARRDDGYSCLLNAFTGCQEQWEIVGSIHDNPELMKGGER